eukprot:5080027-Heterocapsa_arctica.AAC.1
MILNPVGGGIGSGQGCHMLERFPFTRRPSAIRFGASVCFRGSALRRGGGSALLRGGGFVRLRGGGSALLCEGGRLQYGLALQHAPEDPHYFVQEAVCNTVWR